MFVRRLASCTVAVASAALVVLLPAIPAASAGPAVGPGQFFVGQVNAKSAGATVTMV